MAGWFRDDGLVADADPNVSADAKTPAIRTICRPRPGAAPSARTKSSCSTCGASSTVPGAVFADITWMGYTGARVPDRFAKAFDSGRRARATRRSAWSRHAARSGRELRGWEVDRAASSGAAQMPATAIRSCTAPATASARRCTATASTWTTTKRTTIGGCCRAPASPIEPGVYFDDFGVRTEINMIVTRHATRR